MGPKKFNTLGAHNLIHKHNASSKVYRTTLLMILNARDTFQVYSMHSKLF